MIVPPGRLARPAGRLAVPRLTADRRRRRPPPAGDLRHRRALHHHRRHGGGQPARPAPEPVRRRRRPRRARVRRRQLQPPRRPLRAGAELYKYRAAGARSARGPASCSTRAGSPSTPRARRSSPTRRQPDRHLRRRRRVARARSAPTGAPPASSSSPLGVGADAGGIRAVADSVNGRIVLLNPDGSVAAMYGAPAPGPTLLPVLRWGSRSTPPARSTWSTRSARACSSSTAPGGSSAAGFGRAGEYIRTIGWRRDRPQLLSPSALAVSAAGTVYVADTGNGRIVRFSTAAPTSAPSASSGLDPRGRRLARRHPGVRRRRGARNRITVSTATGGDLAGSSAPPARGRGELRSPRGIATDAAGQRVGGRSRQRPRAGGVHAGRRAGDRVRRAREPAPGSSSSRSASPSTATAW